MILAYFHFKIQKFLGGESDYIPSYLLFPKFVFPEELGLPDEQKKRLTDELDENPFLRLQNEFSSYYKLEKHIESSPPFKYDPPEEITVKLTLPEDEDDTESRKKRRKKKKKMTKAERKEKGEFTFQYVSIINTITRIVEDKSLIPDKPSPEGYLKDVKDGQAYKNNKYFQDNPDALTIMLYSDGLELANPLGAAKTVYKAVNVYLTLADIPKHLRSRTENQFLVLAVMEEDLKEHREEVYAKLLEELKQLEEGVWINGRLVKAGLLLHTGDNLELHCIGGFSMNFARGEYALQ